MIYCRPFQHQIIVILRVAPYCLTVHEAVLFEVYVYFMQFWTNYWFHKRLYVAE